MNDALRQAAEVDPKWAQSEQRKFWLLKIVTAGALMAIAVGTVALVLGIHNNTEITQIQHSACAADPAGKECQAVKRESDQQQSVSDACISFHKVGYACPRPGSKAAAKEVRAQAGFQHPNRGDASQPGSTGSQPAGPPKGGHTGGSATPHEAGVNPENGPKSPHEPSVPPSESSPSQPSSPASPAPEGSHSAPTETAEPPTAAAPKQPIRETVGAAGETVNGALEGVGQTECKLLGCKNP